MSLFAAILRALAPLFLLVLLGYGLKRLRMLHAAHVPVFNGLVINVTLPALVLHALVTAPQMPSAYLRLPLALLLAQCVTALLAYGCGCVLRLSKPAVGALLLVGVFGNTGFLGYPITLSLLPHEFPAAVLLDQFGMTIPMYLSAALLGARFGASKQVSSGSREAVLRFLRTPIFLSVTLGIAIRLIPWPHALLSQPFAETLGRAIDQSLIYLGQGTTPVVLLALGVALRPDAARTSLSTLLLACGLKLVACPSAMWVFCHLMHLRGDQLAVGILESAMPTAVTAAILAAHNDMEGDLAVGIVFASTVLSAITVPALLSVLR